MKKFSFILFTTLCSFFLQAQEEVNATDANMRIHDNRWYASPWVWIIGAAIFILLLVALTRGKRE